MTAKHLKREPQSARSMGKNTSYTNGLTFRHINTTHSLESTNKYMTRLVYIICYYDISREKHEEGIMSIQI